ncbi:hypothetical protein BIEPFJAP_00624 [Mannheimia haemolytica]
MSLLKKAQTFISIFNEVRAKNEAQQVFKQFKCCLEKCC